MIENQIKTQNKTASANLSEQATVAGARIFIPISLGNHYYSNARLRRLFEEFAHPSDYTLVFLCDHLRYMSYQIRGEINNEFLSQKVVTQLEQMKVTLAHCGFRPSRKLCILHWKDIATDERIYTISHKLKHFIANDKDVAAQAQLSCKSFLKKFCGSSPPSPLAAELQMQYLVAETALSIFMNECIDFDYEVYRNGSGLVDFLYLSRIEEVKSLSGGTAKRKLLALESIWHENQS